MSLSIVFRAEAQAEFEEAADWYEAQRAGLGDDFIAAVEAGLSRISAMPELHAAVHNDVRRAPVRHFPYTILYRIEPDRALVVAVFHSRRDPAVWQAHT